MEEQNQKETVNTAEELKKEAVEIQTSNKM